MRVKFWHMVIVFFLWYFRLFVDLFGGLCYFAFKAAFAWTWQFPFVLIILLHICFVFIEWTKKKSIRFSVRETSTNVWTCFCFKLWPILRRFSLSIKSEWKWCGKFKYIDFSDPHASYDSVEDTLNSVNRNAKQHNFID